MKTNPTISLTAAAVISNVSERTWWRRIKQGAIQHVSQGSGKQARLLLSDVLPDISISVTSDAIECILRADAGDACAQNDVGQMFLVAGKPKAALYWFQQSANQANSEAMVWLSQCYADGNGVTTNGYLSLMWLAKAASLGHVIAKIQIDDLLQRC